MTLADHSYVEESQSWLENGSPSQKDWGKEWGKGERGSGRDKNQPG